MRTIYLEGGVTAIRKDKNGLFVNDEPIDPDNNDVDTIIIGNTKGYISIPALKTLQRLGINIYHYDWTGKLISQFLSANLHYSATIRIAQYKAKLNKTKTKQITNTIMHYHLQKMNQTLDHFGLDLIDLKLLDEDLQARYYWQRLKSYINLIYPQAKWSMRASFNQRDYRATNPVNAVINYAQSIGESLSRKAIIRAGLDTTIGFWHKNRPTLCEPLTYDIQELIRPQIDMFALEFLKNYNNSSHYLYPPDLIVRLKDATAKALVTHIFDRIQNPPNGRRLDYILNDQVKSLAKSLINGSSFKITTA